MDRDSSEPVDYKVDSWADVEHCVYHALVDAPDELTTHRIAHVVGRIAATLVEKEILTTRELESFLHSCRG
jgi:hypothetical protein